MRITSRMMTDNAVRNMSDSLEKLNKLQEKAATGKNFAYASENPGGAAMSLTLRSTLQTSQAYLDTAHLTNDWMTASDFAFQQMQDLSVRAQNIALTGLNDTLGAGERDAALASEMEEILNNALDAANTSQKGQYIFAGFQINTKPFDLQTDATTTPPTTTLVYHGDTGVMQRSLGPAQSITMNVNGEATFRPFMENLIQIRDALKANDTNSLRTALNGLESSVDQIDQARTSAGARERQVNSATEYLEKT